MDEIDRKYHTRKYLQWVVMGLICIMFGTLAYVVAPTINQAVKGYDRSGIESICEEKYGDTLLRNSMSDEIVLTSFEY